jgi:hypothetical protein
MCYERARKCGGVQRRAEACRSVKRRAEACHKRVEACHKREEACCKRVTSVPQVRKNKPSSVRYT